MTLIPGGYRGRILEWIAGFITSILQEAWKLETCIVLHSSQRRETGAAQLCSTEILEYGAEDE